MNWHPHAFKTAYILYDGIDIEFRNIYKKTVYSYNIPHLFVYSEANDTGLGSISIDISTKSCNFM